MSQTMVAACEDCKVMLVIGQSTNKAVIEQPRMLYKAEQDICALERFLFAHENHLLRIGDLDGFGYELVD